MWVYIRAIPLSRMSIGAYWGTSAFAGVVTVVVELIVHGEQSLRSYAIQCLEVRRVELAKEVSLLALEPGSDDLWADR